jgi:hypothetical protein
LRPKSVAEHRKGQDARNPFACRARIDSFSILPGDMAVTPCTAIGAKDSSKSKSLSVTGGIRPFGLGLKTAYLSMGSLLSI